MANTEISQMIEDCEKRESKLSEWEQTFIDSIGNQLGQGRGLTKKQEETLTKIWERVT